MKKYSAKVAYDGSLYHGFQIQPKNPNNTGEMEKALEKISKTKIKNSFIGQN